MYETLNVSIFKVLSDPTRVRILLALMERSMSVLELADLLNLDQPLVSYHLKHLKKYGIVDVKRVDKYHIYSVNSEKKRVINLLLKTCKEGDVVEDILSELRNELSKYVGDRMANTLIENFKKRLQEKL
ncbi:transcriptional regulator, ArsR family [Ferroglobus placidus DSM 10642]|uniref:Transcriptional regulator, ArsR family n=1 Tax=Ferroglobus placidus (strain DSM 10642 / AEDII12DO) TaxID=589924 RepID=D3RY43_FERPA|nr:metalloregulator ArsR/SmtB family transcription factor [Ferroglobus placidus]ADC65406.1 transcriptional regulator, ArsR family [Ferroglobus placidus DSM 10642]